VTDSQSSPRPREPDRRRALLDAAQRRFLADGFASSTVSSIVREAGVAQGTFYLYFRSKEQVLVDLRGEILAEFLATFRTAVARSGPADARLVRLLRDMYAAMRRNQALIRVVRQAISGEEAERVWSDGRRVLAGPLEELLRAGVADGSFSVDDPNMAAHLTLALFDDLLYEALEYRRPAPGRRTLVDGSRFLLRALGGDDARIETLVPRAEARR
jgi:AcrR family transcriptional regulator